MRTFKLFAAAITLLLLTSQIGLSQANRTLSNLTSPTAVNQHLLPNSTNAINLGSNTLRWKNLFLANREGININPQYPLDIYNKSYDRTINVYSPFTIEQIDRIGVYSKSIIAASWGYGVKALGGYYGVYAYGYVGDADDQSHGVYGEAEGTDCSVFGVAYGVHGKAHGAYDNYGVYGEASGGNACGGFNAAGYFDGAVYATSYHSISDRKFKTNITSMQHPLEQLMKLKPSVYEFKTAEYPNMGLPKGKQMGLIADEVKLVYPELVSEAVNPAH